MPDPTLATVSATEAPALFGVSPYATRWMLYQRFAKGVDMSSTPSSRMDWGLEMQPLILRHAARELRLEVRPSEDYVRRGVLGCTRDATIICPDRGPGALETKCCFDYGVWMREWDGGKFVPRHHEIQLQQQMFVGDGVEPYQWGIIAAWVGAEVFFFERAPIAELWERLEFDAGVFLNDVKCKREPEPFGASIEVEWLTKLFPTVPEKILDLRDHPQGRKLAELAGLYDWHKAEATGHVKGTENLRAKLLAVGKDAETILLPDGVRVKISTTKASAQRAASKRLSVFIPENAVDTSPADFGELIHAG